MCFCGAARLLNSIRTISAYDEDPVSRARKSNRFRYQCWYRTWRFAKLKRYFLFFSFFFDIDEMVYLRLRTGRLFSTASVPSQLPLSIMSPQLCSICCNISGDFWSSYFDRFEYGHMVKPKLQSYSEMQKQKKKGCQLCTVLVNSINRSKLNDHDERLFLRRGFGDSDRTAVLGTEKFPEILGTIYFFRVPKVWCEY